MEELFNYALTIAVLAIIGMGLVLFKHLKFKRELIKLKEDMGNHIDGFGNNEELWVIFDKRTKEMLSFWR